MHSRKSDTMSGVDVVTTLLLSVVPASLVVLAFFVFGKLTHGGGEGGSTRTRKGRPMKKVGTVMSLYCHPIKACHRMELTSGVFDEAGLRPSQHSEVHDREWIVLTLEGKSANSPRLAVVKVAVSEDGTKLAITAPDMTALSVPVKLSGPTQVQSVKTSNREPARDIPCIDAGDEAAEWFSKYLMHPKLRLMQCVGGGSHPEPVHEAWQQSASRAHFASITPCLLMNLQSLADLNGKLPPEDKVEAAAFRPNVVVDTKRPYDEDTWKDIVIGDEVEMTQFEVAPRCPITTINTETGEKHKHYEPLRTLSQYRTDKKLFGIRFHLVQGGQVKVGDPVYCLA